MAAYCAFVQYDSCMSNLNPTEWIAQCAQRLRMRWQTVEIAQLEEVAVEIWRDARLRSLPPYEAAAQWLKPIAGHTE